MSTAQIGIGPWVMRLSVGRRAGHRPQERRPVAIPYARATVIDLPAAAGATDEEMERFARYVDIDEARRSWQVQASLLGIRN